MRIHLLTVGKTPPEWIRHGVREYARRLPPPLSFQLRNIQSAARRAGEPAAPARRKEAARIRAAIPEGSQLIALDEHGSEWSSAELAAQLQRWLVGGRDITMVVGGADGLDGALLEAATQVWSLSRLTLPHALVPILVSEQIYRAWSLLNNHPYHRA